jgi:hypothetical protein
MIVCGTPHYGSYLRNLLLSLANRWDHHHGPLWDGIHQFHLGRDSLAATANHAYVPILRCHTNFCTLVACGARCSFYNRGPKTLCFKGWFWCAGFVRAWTAIRPVSWSRPRKACGGH